MASKLSTNPYIGCKDYLPEDLRKLHYVFSKWRETAKSYGYEEYLTPVLEYAEIYEAKSGEDIRKELFCLMDAGGRRLALRPEMTPSVTRLVSKIYDRVPKPIRLFSIANFFRGEKPQKGRDREFWQLNVDIFGTESIYADLEILMSAIDMMRNFKAPKNSFVLKLNHRKLIEYFLTDVLQIKNPEQKTLIVRKLDKYKKLSTQEFSQALKEIQLNDQDIALTQKWMSSSLQELQNLFPDIEKNTGYKDIVFLLDTLNSLGYGENVIYSSELIRGFDYYDGMIFEIFDQHPSFKRSLFGGGRYNGLAEIFGGQKIPAVGYAPGSPITIFLDNWNLWPSLNEDNELYFLPILCPDTLEQTLKLAAKLRQEGKNVQVGTEVSTLSKSLSYANKIGIPFVVIYGEDEMGQNVYIIKEMQTGNQTTFSYG